MLTAPLQKCSRQPQTKRIAASDKSAIRHKRRLARRRSRDTGTNNSMPLADKAYTAPEPEGDFEAYKPGLVEHAVRFREAFRPERREYITVYFRVRKSNYELLLWQLLSTGVFPKAEIYSPTNLPFWTVSMRLRIRNNFPLGKVMETIRYRLGIASPSMRSCLDGFFGMSNYADAFGHVGACPWMELSNFSTVKSLGLHDGDSIYLSMVTSEQVANVLKMRQALSDRAAKHETAPRTKKSKLNLTKKSTSDLAWT